MPTTLSHSSDVVNIEIIFNFYQTKTQIILMLIIRIILNSEIYYVIIQGLIIHNLGGLFSLLV